MPADPFWHGLSSVTGIWETDIWVRVIKLYARPEHAKLLPVVWINQGFPPRSVCSGCVACVP